MAIRVVLADDEAMIRVDVRAILAAEPDIAVVGEAGDGTEAVELVRSQRPDVVLLDIRMPRLDGLAAAAEIRRVAPGTSVIMLTTFGEDSYVAPALADGVSGFLLKAGSARELITAVRAVADGAAYLSPKIAQQVVTQLDEAGSGADSAPEKVAELTEREREVLALVGVGLSNAAIARRLHLVEDAVQGDVKAILARLDAKSRIQAVIVAYQAELVGL